MPARIQQAVTYRSSRNSRIPTRSPEPPGSTPVRLTIALEPNRVDIVLTVGREPHDLLRSIFHHVRSLVDQHAGLSFGENELEELLALDEALGSGPGVDDEPETEPPPPPADPVTEPGEVMQQGRHGRGMTAQSPSVIDALTAVQDDLALRMLQTAPRTSALLTW